jgi:hypothetical protein
MKKEFHFDSPQEIYTADALVISCIDARFDIATRKFLQRGGVFVFDHIKIPGSAKALPAPETDGDRDFLMRMIRTSMRLHSPARALLIAHRECGAYAVAPRDVVIGDLLRAGEMLRKAERELAVSCYYADFDGIYSVG